MIQSDVHFVHGRIYLSFSYWFVSVRKTAFLQFIYILCKVLVHFPHHLYVSRSFM